MIEIRRVLTHVEDIHHEFGPPAAAPLRRGWLAAVLTNPFAGRYEADILPMMDALNPVGLDMARRHRVPVAELDALRAAAMRAQRDAEDSEREAPEPPTDETVTPR